MGRAAGWRPDLVVSGLLATVGALCDGSIVSFLDPQLMAAVTDLPAMTALADEATTRLDAALAALAPHGVGALLEMQHELDVANNCHPARPNAWGAQTPEADSHPA